MPYSPSQFAEKYRLALESAQKDKPSSGLNGFGLEWNLLDKHLHPLLTVGLGPAPVSLPADRPWPERRISLTSFKTKPHTEFPYAAFICISGPAFMNHGSYRLLPSAGSFRQLFARLVTSSPWWILPPPALSRTIAGRPARHNPSR